MYHVIQVERQNLCMSMVVGCIYMSEYVCMCVCAYLSVHVYR